MFFYPKEIETMLLLILAGSKANLNILGSFMTTYKFHTCPESEIEYINTKKTRKFIAI